MRVYQSRRVDISRSLYRFARCLGLSSCIEAFEMKPSPLQGAEATAQDIVPAPVDTRVDELMRENGALRRQIAYVEALLRAEQEVIPHIRRLSDDLCTIVCDFNVHLESLNENGQSRTGGNRRGASVLGHATPAA